MTLGESRPVPDALTSTLLIVLPVLTVAGWRRVVRGVVTGGAERVLATSVWTVLQFSGGLDVLGWLGVLSMPTGLATQTALTVAVWGADPHFNAHSSWRSPHWDLPLP